MKYKIGDTVWVKITKPECGIYFNKDQCGYEGPGKIDDLELNKKETSFDCTNFIYKY